MEEGGVNFSNLNRTIIYKCRVKVVEEEIAEEIADEVEEVVKIMEALRRERV